MQTSLYDRIGGESAIMAAVDLFYEKVLGDETTRRFFDGVDMAAQTRKMVAFMAWAFDGPSEYLGGDLRASHAKLVRERGLGDTHFDAVARHLKSTLEELGVAPALIEESLSRVAGTRDAVLDR